MRLICPNCDAEYEVDDTAIPDTGRDVQCSNCGHAWFQLPPEIELALEQEDALFGQTASVDPLPDLPDEPPPPPATATAEIDPVRRSVDDNLLAILREEAERESAARRAEGAVLETQPDLGLQPPLPADTAPSPTASRIARMKGVDPEPAAPPRPVARRDLLPDIEEINSSLKGNDPFPQDDAAAAPEDGRGFRSGFAFALVLAVLAAAVYTAAPRIAAHVPSAEAALTAYVAAVDEARVWLDGAIRAATKAVLDLAGQGGPGAEG